jgi:very-short-patch-repair endonuclease
MIVRPRDYDDGLDADGFPLEVPARQPYRPGDERDAGDIAPAPVGTFVQAVIDRAECFSRISDVTDSPIENLLGAAIILQFRAAGIGLKLCKDVNEPRSPGYRLVPQARWGIYRSDWALVNQDTRGVLLIECDGKEFHSSPERIEHDKKKDQAALDRGWLTVRFSGSDIHRDADGLAKRILELVIV